MDEEEKIVHVPSRTLNRKLNLILVIVALHFLVFVGSLIYYFLNF